MRLPFDQNLSFKLCNELADIFPRSDHVGQMGLAKADDRQIWEVVRIGRFTLVSQDADFADLAAHHGPPPKVIWLRCGNRATPYIGDLLRRSSPFLLAFDQNPEAVCFEIY